MTSNLSIYNRKVRTSDQVLKGLIYLAAAATIPPGRQPVYMQTITNARIPRYNGSGKPAILTGNFLSGIFPIFPSSSPIHFIIA